MKCKINDCLRSQLQANANKQWQFHKSIYLLSMCFILTACNSGNEGKYALRDSAVKAYINMVDTSGQYDTASREIKVLKAYIANDTAYLSKLKKEVLEATNDRYNWDVWNADIALPVVQKLGADEVYRFVFSIMSSPYYHVVTIAKTGDSIRMSFDNVIHEDRAVTAKVVRHFDTALQQKEWDDLQHKIKDDDFWNIQKEDGWRATDGSDLTVIGYIKGSAENGTSSRYHVVHRFIIPALMKTFFFVYFNLLPPKYQPY